MALVTLSRRLPESLAKVAVNPDNVQWVGSAVDRSEVILKMLDGPELLIAGHFEDVVLKLNGGSNDQSNAQEAKSSSKSSLGEGAPSESCSTSGCAPRDKDAHQRE